MGCFFFEHKFLSYIDKTYRLKIKEHHHLVHPFSQNSSIISEMKNAPLNNNNNNQSAILAQKVREGYVSHRLNQPETIHLAESLKTAGTNPKALKAVQEELDQFTEVTTDWRGENKTTLEDAQHFLGLDQQFQNLNENKVWSSYDRAVYRRLSAPGNDPAPPQAKDVKSGDPKFVASAQALFPKIDENSDNRLSAVEIDHAMAQTGYTNEESATLVMLRRSLPQLSTCHKDVDDSATSLAPGAKKAPELLSREDLIDFEKNGIPNDSKTTANLNRQLSGLTKQAAAITPAGPLAEEDFDPMAVKQGRAGSCVMLSTEAGVTTETIRNMFQDNNDGTFLVKFLDGKSETVKDLTPTERLYHAKSGDGGRWPGLMEIAMGQRLAKVKPPADGSVRTSVNGQPYAETIPAFSGKTAVAYQLNDISIARTREILTLMAAQDGPFICATRSVVKGNDAAISVESLNTGIANNHAYSITGPKYDPKTDEVFLRNPWHAGEWTITQDGINDGLFKMPVPQFYSNYRVIMGPEVPTA
jgi:hypothetical protein